MNISAYSVFHNPATEKYRAPIGAVCTNEKVRLFIAVGDRDVSAVELVIFGDNIDKTVLLERSGDGFFQEISAPETPCVLFYYFKLYKNGEYCFYGASDGKNALGELSASKPSAFQITVYREGFCTPEWFHKGVMYQIFPDRFAKGSENAVKNGLFYHKNLGRRVKYHKNWNESVDYLPDKGMEYYEPCDFFGGTLKAIEKRLPYLAEMGISVIYLNPVFEAASNHRYNTADYLKIDPVLGDERDFRELCEKAAGFGIKIMLDGVFSHTGDDSVYFNKEERYPGKGAYQGEDSPYFGWYDFRSFPDEYRCWWGFKSLPEVNEHNPEWQDFIMGRVLPHWINAGACGFRLDVADELPDDVLRYIRASVKNADENAVVLGEVWEDATTKEAYGAHRTYALGEALDSVMNYPFRTAICDFVGGKTSAHICAGFLRNQKLNYPKPLYYSLMNLLSSHDVERIRTVLASGLTSKELSREQQASFVITKEQDEKGEKLQKLCAAVQYAIPGVPALYYGDEMGMHGFSDPFNRAPFEENERNLVDFYSILAKIRRKNDALSVGNAAFFAPEKGVLCVLRCIASSADVFGKPAENGVFLVAVNRDNEKKRIVCDIFSQGCGLDEKTLCELKNAGLNCAKCLLSRKKATINDGIITFDIEPFGIKIWEITRG